VDQPPFDKSAMDGYAWKAASPSSFEASSPLRVTSTVAAGAAPSLCPGSDECVRIMTGAPIPIGANAVQRVEWTSEAVGGNNDSIVTFTRVESISNIIRRGENQRAGDLLLSPRALSPQDIGLLASSGYSSVEVARRPVVGVLSTGDELECPGPGPSDGLRPGAIYDSNGPQLSAQAEAMGCEVRRYGVVRDEPGLLETAVARALEECDVLLVSGGVSMGNFDYVPRALMAAGVERLFHGLAMKPGKPTFFGRRGRKAAFGLPGNPMSTFVNFEILVRPHLYRRMGLERGARVLPAVLASTIARQECDRVEFLPARLDRAPSGELAVRPLPYHGSSMLSVLSVADCLIEVGIGVSRLEAGRRIDARLLGA
jgi:molybdopterin molybdotransferase